MLWLVLFITFIVGVFVALTNRDAASRVGIGMATGLGMLVIYSVGTGLAAGQL